MPDSSCRRLYGDGSHPFPPPSFQRLVPQAVPVERSSYSTVADFQQSVHVRVYQGDSRFCKDNLLVGDF